MASIPDLTDGVYLLTWRGIYHQEITPTTYYEDYRNVIFHFDSDGNKIDSLDIDSIQGYDLSLWSFIKYGDSLMVWGNAYSIDEGTVHLALLWLNYNLDFIGLTIIGNYSTAIQFTDCTIVDSSNMVFAGQNSNNSQLILVKTNKTGYYIQEGDINGWAVPWPNICYLPSTNQIICGGFLSVGYAFNTSLTGDSSYTPDIFNVFLGYNFFRSLDSSHSILPGLIMDPLHRRYNVGCIVFDTIGQMTDSAAFDLPYSMNYPGEVDFITRDSIFFGAVKNGEQYYYPFSFDTQDRWYTLYKFNFNGERFWCKYFGGDGNYVLHGLSAMPDGGCLIHGSFYDWRNNPVWERDIVVIKVDSEGLLTSIESKSSDHFEIFPNPAREYFKIINPNYLIYSVQSLHLRLVNLLGNTIIEEDFYSMNDLTISTSPFPAGIYLVIISDEKKMIYSQKVVIQY